MIASLSLSLSLSIFFLFSSFLIFSSVNCIKTVNDSKILSHVFIVVPNSNPNIGFNRIAQRWNEANPCASITTPQIEFHLLVNLEAIQNPSFEPSFNKFYHYIKETCDANLVFTALKSSNPKDELITMNEIWNILASGHVWSKKPFSNILLLNDFIWPLKANWLSFLIEEIETDEIMNEAWNPQNLSFSNDDIWIRADFHRELFVPNDNGKQDQIDESNLNWEIGKEAAFKNPKVAIINMSPASEFSQYYRDYILPIILDSNNQNNHPDQNKIKDKKAKKQSNSIDWSNIKSKYGHFDIFHSVETGIDKNKISEHLEKLRNSTPKALFEITDELIDNEKP